jgi:hypothetical protein
MFLIDKKGEFYATSPAICRGGKGIMENEMPNQPYAEHDNTRVEMQDLSHTQTCEAYMVPGHDFFRRYHATILGLFEE